jgi:hypothetical protein
MFKNYIAGGVAMIGIPEEVKLEYAHDASLLTGIETGKVRLIPLTQGKYALVDEEDYENIFSLKWHAQKGILTYYAIHSLNGGGSVQLHRIILGLSKGDGKTVDHKNRNGLDCRKINLRTVNRSLNRYNYKNNISSNSGYRGVKWHGGRSKRWRAYISKDKKRIFLGLFLSNKDAALAYDDAAIELYGPDAILNFPERSNP